jgi:endonuclease VIII
MPEGDTIHRIARSLARHLDGRVLDRVVLRDRGEVGGFRGRRVQGVRALGKHLLLEVEGGWSLRVHLGMHGRWTRRLAGEPAPPNPTVLLVAGDSIFTCERAYTAEIVRTAALRAHPRLARLGPDLLAEPPDIARAVDRARLPAHAHREIGDLLLDQRIAAGIGNVFKSEILFECRIHPRTPVGDLGDDRLERLFRRAADLLRVNLRTRRRTTVPLRRRPGPGSPRLWVYGREGDACLECGTPIARFLQGDAGRSTWYCPACQPGAGGAADPARKE